MRGGKAPSALPYAGALRPSTPGDFLPDEKVTKESPGAAPLGTRWCEVSALFALAALRSGSRRAGFYHRKRPICHFEMVGESVFVVSFGFDQEKYSAVNPWLGRGLVARLGATLGTIRGIDEGGSSNESATKSLQPTRIRRYSKMFFDCRTSRSTQKKRLVAGWLQAGCRPGCS